jgi:hypothetical protein
VAFLVASADVAVDTGTGEGSWLSLARNLPPGRKAEVDRGLRPRLLDPKTPLDKLERVVDVVDAGDPALAEPVSARLRALALTTPDASERVAAVLLRGLTRGNKRLAADVGCEILGRAVGKDGRVAPRGTPQHVESARQHLVEAALVAVAHARAKCAHAEPLYTVEPCDASMRCGAAAGNETPPDAGGKDPSELPLCARDELLKEIDAAAAARDDRDDYPLVLWVSKGFPRLALGVALGSGAAIDDVKRANARRSYGVSGHSRACPAADLREDACKLHSSRSDEGRCPFVVDDRARRITVKPAADR